MSTETGLGGGRRPTSRTIPARPSRCRQSMCFLFMVATDLVRRLAKEPNGRSVAKASPLVRFGWVAREWRQGSSAAGNAAILDLRSGPFSCRRPVRGCWLAICSQLAYPPRVPSSQSGGTKCHFADLNAAAAQRSSSALCLVGGSWQRRYSEVGGGIQPCSKRAF